MSTQSITGDSVDVSDEACEDLTVLPQTYIVIRIAPDIQETTIEWLLEKIRGKRRDGGAELIVMKEPYNPENVRFKDYLKTLPTLFYSQLKL